MTFSSQPLVSISNAIFAEVVENSRLAHDKKLLQLLQSAYSPESPLFREVCHEIDRLGLRQFQTGQEATPESVLALQPEQLQTTETVAPGVSPGVPQVTSQVTKKERSNSFELMHYIPNSSLTKPAETGISSISVVTKVTDLQENGYVPVKPQKSVLADKIKRYLGRFQLLNRSRHKNSTERKERTVVLPLVTQSPSGVLASSMAARRSSLVGQNLPSYIKSQLVLKGSETAGAAKQAEARTGDNESRISSIPRKKDTRIANLLANLESLYFHQDANSTGGTSLGSNTNNESTISDGDREYILPNSFAQWNDQDQDIYQSSLEESIDDQEDDDDDQYLFQTN